MCFAVERRSLHATSNTLPLTTITSYAIPLATSLRLRHLDHASLAHHFSLCANLALNLSHRASSIHDRSRYATLNTLTGVHCFNLSPESPDKVSLGMRGTLCNRTIPLRFILSSLESGALISDTALAILRLVSYSTSCL
jgi:hypothetical protein